MKLKAKVLLLILHILFSVAYVANNVNTNSSFNDNFVIFIGGISFIILTVKIGFKNINEIEANKEIGKYNVFVMVVDSMIKVIIPIGGIYLSMSMILPAYLALSYTTNAYYVILLIIIMVIIQIFLVRLSYKFAYDFNPTKSEVLILWTTSLALGGYFSFSLSEFDFEGFTFIHSQLQNGEGLKFIIINMAIVLSIESILRLRKKSSVNEIS